MFWAVFPAHNFVGLRSHNLLVKQTSVPQCSSRLPTRKWTRHLRQRPRARGRPRRTSTAKPSVPPEPPTLYSLKDRIDVLCSPLSPITDAKLTVPFNCRESGYYSLVSTIELVGSLVRCPCSRPAVPSRCSGTRGAPCESLAKPRLTQSRTNPLGPPHTPAPPKPA